MKKLSLIFFAIGLYFMCIRLSVMGVIARFFINKSTSLSSFPIVLISRHYETLIIKQNTAEKAFLHMLFNINSNP